MGFYRDAVCIPHHPSPGTDPPTVASLSVIDTVDSISSARSPATPADPAWTGRVCVLQAERIKQERDLRGALNAALGGTTAGRTRLRVVQGFKSVKRSKASREWSAVVSR